MRDLRLTLAADLTAAAGAADAGADDVAADIVEADRHELARFARIADQRLLRLQGLAVAGPEAPSWRRRVVVALPVVPVVGALAISAAAASGVLPLPGGDRHPAAPHPAVVQAQSSAPADTSFRNLVDLLDGDPSASQVIAAASRLHRQIAKLIATSPNNPQGAAAVAELLRMEQNLLMRTQPPGADFVLNATRKLAARLDSVAPHVTSPAVVPTVLPTVAPTPKPTRKSTSTTSPKPSSSPKPTSTQSSKPPSSSPSPSHTPFPALPGG
ncbi:MAG: hypothetical protein QOJ03_726 [Frankiaceae bacterium]|jgi:hypothetical protein|nr:hypothetical protein [Frankiaceae bacterium]